MATDREIQQGITLGINSLLNAYDDEDDFANGIQNNISALDPDSQLVIVKNIDQQKKFYQDAENMVNPHFSVHVLSESSGHDVA